jgi:hypothetical protein
LHRKLKAVANVWHHIRMARLRARNPWLGVAFDAAQMATEAQQVIWLRLMKVSGGARDVRDEMRLMAGEKPAAFLDAHLAAASAFASGRKDHVAAKQALAVYRKKVRANLRRLRRKRR